MTAHEHRRSFRVSEAVYLKHQPLSDEEFDDGIERRRLRLGTDNGAQSQLVDIESRLSDALYMLHSDFDQVGKIITLLNDKLNTAISQLPGLKEARSSLAQTTPQICDVGADGMIFFSASPLAIGSKHYLEFLLESDSRYVETFCTVVREAESSSAENDGLPFGSAVEFNGMKPGQREILIQHMFNRESETLRMRRIELEDSEATG